MNYAEQIKDLRRQLAAFKAENGRLRKHIKKMVDILNKIDITCEWEDQWTRTAEALLEEKE